MSLTRQHERLGHEIQQAISRVIDHGQFVLGPEVREFEEQFASWIGVEESVAVGSGLDALHFSLRALGVGPGIEVITVANTFFATVEAIVQTGARPVLVDCNPATGLMDVGQVEGKITSKTRALIPVHLYGYPAAMRDILEIAQRYGLRVVEDACQAHGARYFGRSAGSLGDAGCFSFYPSKNLGALGDGGAVTTNDRRVAGRIRAIRDHGGRDLHDVLGFTSRLDTLQAAVLLVKLPHLEEWNRRRRAMAQLYARLLSDIEEVLLPPIPSGDVEPSFHLYIILVPPDARDELRRHLAELGIGTGIHYASPLHIVPALKTLGYAAGSFPQAELRARSMLSLPLFPEMTEEDVMSVVEGVRSFFALR